jgi:hypothetical protein
MNKKQTKEKTMSKKLYMLSFKNLEKKTWKEWICEGEQFKQITCSYKPENKFISLYQTKEKVIQSANRFTSDGFEVEIKEVQSGV